MSFPLANSPIADKIRQSMYLKHLRQVELINNREPDALKKELTSYRSITELHHKNKVKSNQRKLLEHEKFMETRNLKIFNKIQNIDSDRQLQQGKNRTGFGSSPDMEKSPDLHLSTARTECMKKSLHYSYRKRESQRIERENEKMQKAINLQRSTLLPSLGHSKRYQSTNHSTQ